MKFKLFILTVAIIAGGTNSFATETTADYLDMALNYQNSGQASKAVEYANYVLELEPENTFANEIIKNYSDLETKCEAQKTFSPKTDKKVLAQSDKTAETENTVKDARYFNLLGEKFLAQRNYDEALSSFYKSLTCDNKNYVTYNNLAIVYQYKNNFLMAEKYYKQAYKLKKNSNSLINLAMLYKENGQKEKSVKYFKKAVKIDPNNSVGYYLLGKHYRECSNYDCAISNLEQAIQINPQNHAAQLLLALCYFEVEEFSKSADLLNCYIQAHPNSDYAYALLSKCLFLVNDYEGAKNALVKALLINECAQYKFEFAKLEYALKNYKEALVLFEELASMYTSPVLSNYLGLCKFKTGNYSGAESDFKTALKYSPQRIIYFYNLSLVYKALNNTEECEKLQKMIANHVPSRPQDTIDLSYIKFDCEDSQQALDTLESGIRTWPNEKSLYLTKLNLHAVLKDDLGYNKTKALINERFNNYGK